MSVGKASLTLEYEIVNKFEFQSEYKNQELIYTNFANTESTTATAAISISEDKGDSAGESFLQLYFEDEGNEQKLELFTPNEKHKTPVELPPLSVPLAFGISLNLQLEIDFEYSFKGELTVGKSTTSSDTKGIIWRRGMQAPEQFSHSGNPGGRAYGILHAEAEGEVALTVKAYFGPDQTC